MSQAFLKVLPKFIIDFPEVDLSDYGDIKPAEEQTEEERAQGRADRKAELEANKVDHKQRLNNFIDTLSTIQQYYGKVLNILNIKSIMAEVAQCYTEGIDIVALGRAQCRAYLKLSLQELPEVVGQFFIMEVQDDPNLSPEQKKELINEYQTNIDGAEEVIAFVKAFVKGFGDWPTTASEGAITGYVSDEFVGKPLNVDENLNASVDIEAGRSANEAWARGQPLLGRAKEGQKDVKELAQNMKKIDKFMDAIDEFLDISKFCDKIASQIPSIASLASTQNIDGRPGDIGALNNLDSFPDQLRDQFAIWEKAPTIELSSDFSFPDVLAFIGQQIWVTLEKAALEALQAVVQGLMKDWLAACQGALSRGNIPVIDIDGTQRKAREALEDTPTATITYALTAAAPSPLNESLTLELIYFLMHGLTKDEICSLFKGTPSDPILKMLEERVRKDYPELYFAGLNKLQIRAVFKELGNIIDLEFCEEDEEIEGDVRFCLNPAAEHAQGKWLEAHGIDPETAAEILDKRRADGMEKLANLLQAMMSDNVLPQNINIPPISVDEPYLKEIILRHTQAVYANIFDSLVGELGTFKTLNLDHVPTPTTAPPSEEDDWTPGFSQFSDPEGEFMQELRARAEEGGDKNVNSRIFDLLFADPYQDDVTDQMLDGPIDPVEMEEEGRTFKLTDSIADYVVESTAGDDDSSFKVHSRTNLGDVLFESEATHDFDLFTLLLSSNFETKLEPPLAIPGPPHKAIADKLVQANYINVLAQMFTEEGITWNTNMIQDFFPATMETAERLSAILSVIGRRALNDGFRTHMMKSKLFKMTDFNDLEFTFEDPCLPIFEQVKLIAMDETAKSILQNYQTLLDANLGDFKIVNAVMLTSLVYTLTDIYIYEFLLAFVYFGTQVEDNFYASDTATTALADLLLGDLKALFPVSSPVDNLQMRDDLYNVILNIPFIEPSKLDGSFRYNPSTDIKHIKVKEVLKELITQTINKGDIFNQYKTIFGKVTGAATDGISQFQKTDEVDDLQAIVVGLVRDTSSANHSWKWFGDMRYTKTHSAAIIDEAIFKVKWTGLFNEETKEDMGEFLEAAGFKQIYTSNRFVLEELLKHESQFILEPYIKIPLSDGKEVVFSLLDLQFIVPTSVVQQAPINEDTGDTEPLEDLELRETADIYAELPSLEGFEDFNKIKMMSEEKNWKLGLRLSLVDARVSEVLEKFDDPDVAEVYADILGKANLNKKLLTQHSEFGWMTPWEGYIHDEDSEDPPPAYIDPATETHVATEIHPGASWDRKTFTTLPLLKEEVEVSGLQVLEHMRDYVAYEKWYGSFPPEDAHQTFDDAQHLVFDIAVPKTPSADSTWGGNEYWDGRNSSYYLPMPEFFERWAGIAESTENSGWDASEQKYKKRLERIFRGPFVKLRQKMFSSDNNGFNLLVRFLFSGSDLITAYRLFFTFNNNDPRFGQFPKADPTLWGTEKGRRTILAKTKGNIVEKMKTLLYGTSLTTIALEAAEDNPDNFANTNAAIAKLAAETVPKIVKGICDKYDPGYVVLKEMKSAGHAETDSTVLTHPEGGFPYLAFITTPIGLAYAAAEGWKPEEEVDPCDPPPTVEELESVSVETTEDITGVGLIGEEPTGAGNY